MNRSSKYLSLLLAIIMLMGIFCIPAMAEQGVSDDDDPDNLCFTSGNSSTGAQLVGVTFRVEYGGTAFVKWTNHSGAHKIEVKGTAPFTEMTKYFRSGRDIEVISYSNAGYAANGFLADSVTVGERNKYSFVADSAVTIDVKYVDVPKVHLLDFYVINGFFSGYHPNGEDISSHDPKNDILAASMTASTNLVSYAPEETATVSLAIDVTSGDGTGNILNEVDIYCNTLIKDENGTIVPVPFDKLSFNSIETGIVQLSIEIPIEDLLLEGGIYTGALNDAKDTKIYTRNMEFELVDRYNNDGGAATIATASAKVIVNVPITYTTVYIQKYIGDGKKPGEGFVFEIYQDWNNYGQEWFTRSVTTDKDGKASVVVPDGWYILKEIGKVGYSNGIHELLPWDPWPEVDFFYFSAIDGKLARSVTTLIEEQHVENIVPVKALEVTNYPNPHTITTAALGDGTAALGSQTVYYDDIATVTATADSISGSTVAFDGWYIGDQTVAVSTDPVYSFVVHGDVALTAKFTTTKNPPILVVPITGTSSTTLNNSLTIAIVGNGTLLPAEGTYSYSADSIVVLNTPMPAAGWKFSKWDGIHGSEVVINDVNHQITLNGNKQITAVFVEDIIIPVSPLPQSVPNVQSETPAPIDNTAIEVIETPVQVPQAAPVLPKTGGIPMLMLMGFGVLLSSSGLFMKHKK